MTIVAGRSAASRCRVRRIPQWSSAWEISLLAYVPRGVVGMPIRFYKAAAQRSQLVDVVGDEALRNASSFAATASRSSPSGCPPPI